MKKKGGTNEEVCDTCHRGTKLRLIRWQYVLIAEEEKKWLMQMFATIAVGFILVQDTEGNSDKEQ
jgi:hypothetical protein